MPVIIIAGMIVISFSHLLLASGTTSAEFLKLSPFARNTALGETGVATPDISGTFYNPAGMAFLIQGEASFSHLSHFQDINYSHAAAAYPTQSGTFAGAVGSLTIPEFQGYDRSGNPASNVSASDTKISLMYANYIMGDAMSPVKIGAGIGTKFIIETLAQKSANTAAFDVGFVYSSLVADMPLMAGLSVSNLGGSLKFNPQAEQADPIPMIIRIGALYSLTLSQNPFNISLDAAMSQGDPTAIGLGFEYIIKNTLAVRTGYTTQATPQEGMGIRFGFGVKLLGVEFDYAAAPQGELGYSHRAAVSVKFGQQIVPYTVGMPSIGTTAVDTTEMIFNRGVKLYEEGRYPESIIEFNKVLEQDPTNSKALEYMKKASEKIKK